MKLPTFTNQKLVKPDGFLTNEMQMYFDNQSQVMQKALSDNGWTLPQISAANLAKIAPQMPNGTLWYDSDNHVGVIKMNGVLRKITTAVYP